MVRIPLGEHLLEICVPHGDNSYVSISKIWTVVSELGGWGLVETALLVPAGVGVAETIMRLFVYIIIGFVYCLIELNVLVNGYVWLVFVAAALFVVVFGAVGELGIV